MRRKSERTSIKKSKASPEKKVEKVKKTKTRRRKQSASSDNESGDEVNADQLQEIVVEVAEQPKTPVKESNTDEAQDQVWQVKTAEGSKDTGEIQKLKICLTRPPNTPERVDRSPRSKRKYSRATSSSDTPSVEGSDEKKKSKHKSKRSNRESKDEVEINHDSQGDEHETENDTHINSTKKMEQVISQSNEPVSAPDETPISTTCEAIKSSDENTSKITQSTGVIDTIEKASVADTTVASPQCSQANEVSEITSEKEVVEENPVKDDDNKTNKLVEEKEIKLFNKEVPQDKTIGESKFQEEETTMEKKVSIVIEDKTETSLSEGNIDPKNENNKGGVETNVVESTGIIEKGGSRKMSTDSNKDETSNIDKRDFNRLDSTQSTQEDAIINGQAAPIVINRKRRWGSRPSKVSTQRSITISTDVLKGIIPDVKPAEFDEVIEEKKHHKRVEMTERLERPVLPKIVIDNTENMEQNNKHHEKKERENVKQYECHLSSNRKISIVKDSESIIARPPSPPRHKQSNILFITNLVRPFTLPQLKNLLQRTGRIVEDGFWIDKIKSKCFVKYEKEDQAVETRHALHGVTWPNSNPKTLQVDFSNDEAFGKAKLSEETDHAPTSAIPGTVEAWLREQDMKRERGEIENKPWERKAVREWDMGKNGKDKDNKDNKLRKDDRSLDKRRHRTPERSPEPAKKFKKKEEEAPAKLLDDLFRKTKTTPCIYWLPLSTETIAIKEEQRRKHMAEHERRLQEIRRTHRRH